MGTLRLPSSKAWTSTTITVEPSGEITIVATPSRANTLCETSLSELFTEPITRRVLELSAQPSDGPKTTFEPSNKLGSTSTPESENGTVELSVTFKPREGYKIALATESFTLTDQTISYLKASPGFLNLPWQWSVVEQLCSCAKQFPGQTFFCRYTTAWFYKSQGIEKTRVALRNFEELSKCLSRIPILSTSPGDSQ